METVVILIHLMVIVAMVALVLLQRSEGGALGIGGGGGGFTSSRGQGNVLTRSTAILAIAFFGTSIVLSILAQLNAPPSAILDEVPAATAPSETETAPGSGQGILDQLEGMSQPEQAPTPGTAGDDAATPSAPAEPQVPTSQ